MSAFVKQRDCPDSVDMTVHTDDTVQERGSPAVAALLGSENVSDNGSCDLGRDHGGLFKS